MSISWRKDAEFPIGNPGNPGGNVDLGSTGSGGAISIVNIIERLARKLGIIILLHSGLVTFRIDFRKSQKVSVFMFSDSVDVSMTPNTNTIFGDTRILQVILENAESFLKQEYSLKFQSFGNRTL